MSETIALALPETPAATESTEPVATATEIEANATQTKPTEPAVDLKLWARTNAAAREASAKVKDLEAKLKEAEDKLTAKPDEQTARQAALSDMLKQPGAAKKLIEAGWTFDTIVAELTDIPVVDPAVKAITDRQDKLEQDLKAEREAKAKLDEESKKAQADSAVKSAQDEITRLAKDESKNTVVTDEKDSRFGTARWVIVADRPDLIEEARDAAVKYVVKRGKPVTDEQAELLVCQALDQLELAERAKLEPIVKKIVPKPPINRTTDLSSRISERPDDFARPRTITSDLRGPAPIKTSKERYSGGPRKISYIPG